MRKNKEDCVIYLLDMRKILSKQVRDILRDIFQADDMLKLGFDGRNNVRNFSLTLIYNGLAGCNKVLIFHLNFYFCFLVINILICKFYVIFPHS